MKQVYETEDGQRFDKYEDAERHEQSIFAKWLAETGDGAYCTFVLEHVNNTCKDENYGTPRDFAMEFVKVAFGLRNETRSEP